MPRDPLLTFFLAQERERNMKKISGRTGMSHGEER